MMQIPGITDFWITLIEAPDDEALPLRSPVSLKRVCTTYPVVDLAAQMANPEQLINQCVYETLKVFIEPADLENLKRLEQVKQEIESEGVDQPIPFRLAKSKKYQASIDIMPGGTHTFGGELWITCNDTDGRSRRQKLFDYRFHPLSLNLFKKLGIKEHVLSVNSAHYWRRIADMLPIQLHFDLQQFLDGADFYQCVDAPEEQWQEMQKKLLN